METLRQGKTTRRRVDSLNEAIELAAYLRKEIFGEFARDHSKQALRESL